MEWLRKILESAKITEDGNLDVDSVMSTINTEFPKNAVPKNVFNDKVTELKTASKTIEDLKKSNGDNEALQNTIAEHEKTIQALQEQTENTAKTYALKEQLVKSGVLDADYIIYKQGGIDKFTFDAKGNPIGIDDVLKPMKEDKTMGYLFGQTEHGAKYRPVGGSGTLVKNPWAKDSFNLTEQGKIYKEDPAKAKEMMSAAGVEI